MKTIFHKVEWPSIVKWEDFIQRILDIDNKFDGSLSGVKSMQLGGGPVVQPDRRTQQNMHKYCWHNEIIYLHDSK